MVVIDSNQLLCSFCPRTLKVVRDDAVVLYNCVSAQGHEECQGDILAVSEMAEDIRDALLEYQVGNEGSRAATIAKLSNRRSSNGRYMTRIAD